MSSSAPAAFPSFSRAAARLQRSFITSSFTEHMRIAAVYLSSAPVKSPARKRSLPLWRSVATLEPRMALICSVISGESILVRKSVNPAGKAAEEAADAEACAVCPRTVASGRARGAPVAAVAATLCACPMIASAAIPSLKSPARESKAGCMRIVDESRRHPGRRPEAGGV